MDSVRRPSGQRGAENALRYRGATAGAVSRRCYRVGSAGRSRQRIRLQWAGTEPVTDRAVQARAG